MTEKNEPSIWRQAYDLFASGEIKWGMGTPEYSDPDDGVRCMCAGGAVAKVLTGSAYDMYSPRADPWMQKLADHVEATAGIFDVNTIAPAERVYVWNDRLDPASAKETVMRVLLELDELERAK